jgi:hypothetical protein
MKEEPRSNINVSLVSLLAPIQGKGAVE